jgi:Ras-related protein Rab-1A
MSIKITKYDHVLKFLIIGDSGVGKTSLLLKYSNSEIPSNINQTIGIDFKIKNVMVDDDSVKLQIWDTAGQERFMSITASYFRGSHAVVFVYDISDAASFMNLKIWLSECDARSGNDVVKLLVGNKSEALNRAVTFKEAKLFANLHNMNFIETSTFSKTHEFNDELINVCREIIIKKRISQFKTYNETKMSRSSSINSEHSEHSARDSFNLNNKKPNENKFSCRKFLKCCYTS